MTNSKLLRLISALSINEMQHLRTFLLSPFFNTNPSIIKLYDALYNAYPKFDSDHIKKETIHNLIYPGKPFNDNSFRNLILNFTKLVQEYLTQLELKNRENLQNQLLLNTYSKRLLKRDFNDLFSRLLKTFQAFPPKSSDIFLDYYLLLKEYYHFPETNRRAMEASLPSMILSSLNQFFALSKLQLAIEFASRKEVLKEEIPDFFFKKYIPEYISVQPLEVRPLLEILLSLENFYTSRSKEQIEFAKQLFKTHHQKFSLFDKKMILTVLVNQMNYLFRSGEEGYLKELYHLYKFSLSNKILLFNNSLIPIDFMNIVTTASRNNETKWALDFIQRYKKFLPEKDKDQLEALGYATVYYDIGEFNKVTEVLNPYSFRKTSFGLRFRFISIKAYVELVFQDSNNLKFTETFVLRMEQYIKRGARKGDTRESLGFKKFLKAIKMILKICRTKGASKEFTVN